MANCTAPNQIANGICDESFAKLQFIAFIDTVENTTRPEISTLGDRATVEALIAAKELFLLDAKPTEIPEQEINTVEIGTDQYFAGFQEMRYKLKVSMNRDEYSNFANYNYFSNKEAYIMTRDNKIANISDGAAVAPKAYGLGLNMVQVGVAPVFTDGVTLQSFYIYVNFSPEQIQAINAVQADYEISTLDPTYTV